MLLGAHLVYYFHMHEEEVECESDSMYILGS